MVVRVPNSPRAVALVAVGLALALAGTVALPSAAAFRATSDISGLLCGPDGADCVPVSFEEAVVPGNFALTNGAVFDAVTARDRGTGLCRIDLADAKLGDESRNMRNLLRAKFVVDTHDGLKQAALNTIELACVEE